MIVKNSCLNLRVALLLAVCIFATIWPAMRAAGQSERPRRVPPETPSKDQSKETKPASDPSSQSSTATDKKPSSTPASSDGKPSDAQSQQPPTQQTQSKPGQTGKPPAGKQAEPEEETIRINSRLVTVPVSVTDANGTPVRNLTAEDFVVEEDGATQQVQTLGEPGKTPLEMVLLFDVSRSIRNRFDFEREAAGRLSKKPSNPAMGFPFFLSAPNRNFPSRAPTTPKKQSPTH